MAGQGQAGGRHRAEGGAVGPYLKAYQNGRGARVGIGDFFRFYSTERSHQVLGYLVPAEVFTPMPVEAAPGGIVES